MNEKLKEKIKESLSGVLPITVIVLLLSITLVPIENGIILLFLTGALLLIVGMGFFQLGAEMAMTPLGQGVGGGLSKSRNIFVITLICFVTGAIITVSEPDLQVLANQVASIPNNVLIWTVAVGVGIFLAAAVLRIVFHISLSGLLAVLYALLFILSFFSPSEFTAVAFDAGGVTTGPMTVPFIMAAGFSDDVIDAARAAGAKGGTVLKGLRCNSEGVSKQFGVSRQAEQDFVMIVTAKAKKTEVMSAISSSCGLGKEAHGIVLAFPVDDAMGLEE